MSTADTIGLIFPITALLVGLISQVHTATTWVRNVVSHTWNPPPLQIWLVCSLGVLGIGQCLRSQLRSRISPKHVQPIAAAEDGCSGAMDVPDENKHDNAKSEACSIDGSSSDVQERRRQHSSSLRTGKLQNTRIEAKIDISSSARNSVASRVSLPRVLQHQQCKDDNSPALSMRPQHPAHPMDKRQQEHLYLQRVRWQELGPDRGNRWSGRRPLKEELRNDQQKPWINLAIVDRAVRCIGPPKEVNLQVQDDLYGPSPAASEASMVVDYTGLCDAGGRDRDALDSLAKGLSSLGFDAMLR